MTAHRFMFATGIENSYPTIKNGSIRIDELETGGHYKHWETDFALLQDLDIRYLRYGPPIHRTWLAHDRYDWDFADQIPRCARWRVKCEADFGILYKGIVGSSGFWTWMVRWVKQTVPLSGSHSTIASN